MARKPNYDYEKRRKEQERKAKKDAKRAEREQRREEQRNDGAEVLPEDADGLGIPRGTDETQADGDAGTADVERAAG